MLIYVIKIGPAYLWKLNRQSLKILDKRFATSNVCLIKMQKTLVSRLVADYLVSKRKCLLIIQGNLFELKLKCLLKQGTCMIELLNDLAYLITAKFTLIAGKVSTQMLLSFGYTLHTLLLEIKSFYLVSLSKVISDFFEPFF